MKKEVRIVLAIFLFLLLLCVLIIPPVLSLNNYEFFIQGKKISKTPVDYGFGNIITDFIYLNYTEKEKTDYAKSKQEEINDFMAKLDKNLIKPIEPFDKFSEKIYRPDNIPAWNEVNKKNPEILFNFLD